MPIYGAGIGSRTYASTLVVLNSQQPVCELQQPTCNRLIVPPSYNPPGTWNTTNPAAGAWAPDNSSGVWTPHPPNTGTWI